MAGVESLQETEPQEQKVLVHKSFVSEFAGTALILLGTLLFLALISYEEPPVIDGRMQPISNVAGSVGHFTARLLMYAFGSAAYLPGPYLIILGFLYIYRGQIMDPILKLAALIILLFGVSVMSNIIFGTDPTDASGGGGALGQHLGGILERLFGGYGAGIIATGLLAVGFFLGTRLPLSETLQQLRILAERQTLVTRKLVQRRNDADGNEMQTENEKRFIEKTNRDAMPWFTPANMQATDHSIDENVHTKDHADSHKPASKNEIFLPDSEKSEASKKLSHLLLDLKDGRNLDPEAYDFASSGGSSLFHGQFNHIQDRFRFTRTRNQHSTQNLDLAMHPIGKNSVITSPSETVQEEHRETMRPGNIELPAARESNERIEDSMLQSIPDSQPLPLEESIEIESAASKEQPGLATSEVPAYQMQEQKYGLPVQALEKGPAVANESIDQEIELTRERLERVLKDFDIQAKIVRMQRGPIVTLYEIKLEPGVKVARILGIQDEIKMNLEAASVRIMAPLPGKNTVGIEIPNCHRDTVVMGDIVRNDPEFMKSDRELAIVLGKDIEGTNNYVDLTRLPHLLIAGATGSGKSVYMNAVIASILYTRSPEEVRFIMIDPKLVELSLFQGIPHLLMPVITDVKMAGRALSWAVREMETRYSLLSQLKCRDIRSYNQRLESVPGSTRMPYIVVLIDELSDLMMVSAKEVEDSIIRLTQKARAVGIHVIMATQRPSVDVITALIKANCPARIAFQVAQKTDSRTILDSNGAEALVGRGDMLYRAPDSSGLRRLQTPLITETEIENITAAASRFGKPDYVDLQKYESSTSGSSEFDSEVEEGLYDDAWDIVIESGKTSVSYLQRRLRIGYNRAARLIEMMEERGRLSPPIGNKPREILKKS